MEVGSTCQVLPSRDLADQGIWSLLALLGILVHFSLGSFDIFYYFKFYFGNFKGLKTKV